MKVCDNINVLLIGLGKIGCGYDSSIIFEENIPNSSEKIISHARAVSCHPSFNLIAGIDENKNACERFEFIYKKPTFSNLSSFIKYKNSIDMIIIAVPPKIQPKLIEQVFSKLKPRILLIEKPIAISLSETKSIIEICKKNKNTLVLVNYVRRYLPEVEELRKKISTNKLGKFIYGNIVYGKGLLTNGCHFINLAQYWIGKLNFHETLNIGPQYDSFDYETSFVLKSNDNNSILNVNSIGGYNLRAGELDLWFEKGRISWMNDGKSLSFWPRLNSKTILDSYDSLSEISENKKTNVSKCQFYVLESIKKHLEKKVTKVPCNLDDAVETMRLMQMAFNFER